MCDWTSHWCLRGTKFSYLFNKPVRLINLPFGRQEHWAIENLNPWPKATGLRPYSNPGLQTKFFTLSIWLKFCLIGSGRGNLSLQELFLCSCLHMKHYFPFYFEPCFSAIKRFIIAGCFLPAKSIELNYKHCLAFCHWSYLLMGGWFLVSSIQAKHLNCSFKNLGGYWGEVEKGILQ